MIRLLSVGVRGLLEDWVGAVAGSFRSQHSHQRRVLATFSTLPSLRLVKHNATCQRNVWNNESTALFVFRRSACTVNRTSGVLSRGSVEEGSQSSEYSGLISPQHTQRVTILPAAALRMVRAGLSTGPGASAKMAAHSVWHPSWGRYSLDSVAEWGRAGERLGTRRAGGTLTRGGRGAMPSVNLHVHMCMYSKMNV